ncbi:uncharacterized protein LOC141628893 [Silene latifolia]|uniref:uncharacterized protein LOC141628893 n=1 Tax=Silene latifolia TaxID=37657 RepID=UPI003D77C67A
MDFIRPRMVFSDFSLGCSGIPQSAEALKSKEVNEIVGIPVLDMGRIVEDDKLSQPEKEVDAEWTQVKGKRSSSSPIGTPSASSKGLLQLTSEDVESELQFWDTAVVCYVLGDKPSWELLSGFIQKLWGVYKFDKLSFLPNGVFLVRFPTKECQSLAFQQGFLMFDNKPLVVKPWSESCSLMKERVKSVPIWLRLCGLPMKFWSKSCLKKLAGLLRKFIKRDSATEDKTRLGYARLLVEVDIGQEFPDKLFFKDEKGSEVCVLVEYEWKPTVCSSYKGIGRTQDMCRKKATSGPVTKPIKPVPKPGVKVWRPVQRTGTELVPPPKPTPQNSPVLFGGPTYNNSAHIPYVPVIEQITRQERHTLRSDISPAKSYVEALSPTKQSSQNGGQEEPPGTVTEISTGDCFVLTVVYGFNDDGDRMSLWQELKHIHDTYSGPWGICGDFNNVLHYNKRIGRDCVQYCEWMDLYPFAYARFLPEGLFDHNPVVCYRRQDRVCRRQTYRYYNMWSLDPGFKEIVQQIWLPTVKDSLMYQIVTKLKKLKKPLKELNRNNFSDVDKAVGVAKALLEDIQQQIYCTPTDHSLIEAEMAATDSLRHLSKVQHSFMSPKAKVEWLANGDDNTQIFHNHIRARQIHNSVLCIKGTDEVLYSNPTDIENAFLTYYKGLLGTSLATTLVHAPTVRTRRLVTPDHHVILLAPITAAEFFKDTWETIGDDIIAVVKDFFTSGNLLKELNTINLTLIPKMNNPTSVLDFILIACCNTDLARLYNRKAASPRCLIKIDLGKAYDSVEWVFLEQIMKALQFSKKFIHLVMLCVTSSSYTLVVNAQQADFIFHPLCGHLRLNHLLFADDLLLFCKGNEQSIMWILRSFATFSADTSLTLNKSKSEIYFNGVAPPIVKDILQVSGFHKGTLPLKYLGVPISTKKLTKREGLKLTDRIVARIRVWGTRHLSYAGRLTLVTSVLSTLHSYWASIFLIPSAIMNIISSIYRNFLWSGKSEYQKSLSISWDTCCLPKEEGGLGIKDVKCWNKALLGKYAWWLATKQDHLWVKWVNHVYLKGKTWSTYTPPPDCSWSWRKITHTMQVFHQAYTCNKWLNAVAPYTVQAGYQWLRIKAPKVEWRHICWNQLNVPKYSFIFWSIMHSRLLTKARLQTTSESVRELISLGLVLFISFLEQGDQNFSADSPAVEGRMIDCGKWPNYRAYFKRLRGNAFTQEVDKKKMESPFKEQGKDGNLKEKGKDTPLNWKKNIDDVEMALLGEHGIFHNKNESLQSSAMTI